MAVDDATTASKDITTRIEEEGIVLLENKDNALPLNTEKNAKAWVSFSMCKFLIFFLTKHSRKMRT